MTELPGHELPRGHLETLFVPEPHQTAEHRLLDLISEVIPGTVSATVDRRGHPP